jgi:GTA TIM-barrel-like domain
MAELFPTSFETMQPGAGIVVLGDNGNGPVNVDMTIVGESATVTQLGAETTNRTTADATNATLVPAIDNAKSIVLTVFNEFDLSATTILNSEGNTFNASLDQLVNNITPSSCQANFVHTVQGDLAAIPNIDTVMLWVQDFTLIGGSNVPNSVVPAINSNIASLLTSPTQWSAQGQNASTALNLVGSQGGTSDDTAFLSGARYLIDRGYNIGLYPIVIGIDNTAGLLNSESLTWRGFFTWPTIEIFDAWLADYIAFVTYYVQLLHNAGLPLKRCSLGSEFNALTLSSPNNQWAAWVAGLQGLAATVLSFYPECQITYAANYTEYGVGSEFRIDSLWTSPNISFVGVDWYQPLTLTPTQVPQTIRSGLRAGNNFDFTQNLPASGSQFTMTGSNGLGTSQLEQFPIDASVGIKNLIGFYRNGHFLSPQSGNIAESTPLPGFDRTFNPNGLGLMQGTGAIAASGSPFVSPGTSGMHPIPNLTDTWFLTNGTTFGSFTLPAFTATISTLTINIAWQLTSATPTDFARLLECDGFFEILADTGAGSIKLGIGGTNEEEFVVCPIDTNVHNLSATINYSTLQMVMTIDGTQSTFSVSASAAVKPPASTEVFVGCFNATNNNIAARFFQLGIILNTNIGGTFNFDEVYAGVRTAWVPQSKPIIITELGFGSYSGTCVEPSQFVFADFGLPILTPPATLNSFTTNFLETAFASNWAPSQIFGAFGATFNIDQTEQYYGLQTSCNFFKSLEDLGIIEDITIYTLDARPSQAMLAKEGSNFFYQDGPTSFFAHSINGKISGGGLYQGN